MDDGAVKLKTSLLLLSIVKIFITSSQKIYAIGNAIHDDRLFVNLATRLIRFFWLGGYNDRTLTKGPMYPIWLAITSSLGIPLLLAQQLLYIAAGLVVIIALRRVIANNILLVLLFGLYLFNPITVGGPLNRVMREGIYSSLTVLVIACMIAILVRYKDPMSRLIIWAVGLGLALSAFWLTREEGLWILPGLFLLMAFTIFSIYQFVGLSAEFFKRCLICFLPFLILLISINSVSLINKMVYGTYTVVEVKSDSFVSAYGALCRVNHPHPQRYIPVPKEVRESIYQVSPAFNELRPYLEGDLGKNWAVHGKHLAPSGDLAGGWFMWALRDAAALAGHHSSGAEAEAYYSRLAKEINEACDRGLLSCSAERRTMVPPFRPEYISLTASSFEQGLAKLISFGDFSARTPASLGDGPSLELFRHVTHNALSPAVQDQDTAQNPPARELVLLLAGENLKTQILNYVGLFYRTTMPYLAGAALLCYIIAAIGIIFKKSATLFIINTALVVAVAVRLLLLAYIDVTSFPCINILYLSPAYPLMLIWVGLSIIDLWSWRTMRWAS
jgi:hypothetical protein